MAYEFITERRVEFHETDMAGIVHFSNFFRYMEATEHAFLRELGLAAHEDETDRMAGFARVHASCEYRHPLRYPQKFVAHLVVKRIGEKSIRYIVRFLADASEIAHGEMVVVYVERETPQSGMVAASLPQRFRDSIEEAPPGALSGAGTPIK